MRFTTTMQNKWAFFYNSSVGSSLLCKAMTMFLDDEIKQQRVFQTFTLTKIATFIYRVFYRNHEWGARYYCPEKLMSLRHIRSATCKMMNIYAILSWMWENLIQFSESSNQAWTWRKICISGKNILKFMPSKSEIIILGATSMHRTLRSELHQYVLLSISWWDGSRFLEGTFRQFTRQFWVLKVELSDFGCSGWATWWCTSLRIQYLVLISCLLNCFSL